MCNRARFHGEAETLFQRFGGDFLAPRPMDNRFNPRELRPKGRAWIIREEDGHRGVDVAEWDVTAGKAPWPMTNVRNLALPQWRELAAEPANRCLVPLTAFCEFTPEKHDLGDGKQPLKGEMWFNVTDQPVFAVGGFSRTIGDRRYFAMVTCDPNELVAPIHPKAMITILPEDTWNQWLTGSYDNAVALQRPYPAERMTVAGPVFPTRGR